MSSWLLSGTPPRCHPARCTTAGESDVGESGIEVENVVQGGISGVIGGIDVVPAGKAISKLI